ncbi:MAG: DUF1738 domain-containing protein [Parasporobacterium sp.]|nr:DUF1738 domain-containing protein [Parasporobacterium sp.]
MSRPQNKDAFRKEMAEAFAHILEEKGLQWKKEWSGFASAPQNGVTKANYRGCNAFWLSIVAMSKGYTDPRWVTMRQIQDFDGRYHPNEKWHLKKGSKASYVEYWYPLDQKEKKAVTWPEYREALKNGRKPDEFRLSTRYTPVFNACDIEGMPQIEAPVQNDISEDELIRLLSEGMGVKVLNDGGDKAYYSPMQDMIHLPEASAFTSDYAYNATALHELSHASGHPSRLNRPHGAFFGTGQYAYEELVAEMSSCFMGVNLNTELTPEHMENHKAYVQSWIQSIREKPEMLVKAIKDAQSAADYMEYKAGLLPEQEYEKRKGTVMEVKPKEKELER